MLGLLCLCLLLVGCGGLPQPKIDGRTPRADQTLVRVAIIATNYDEAWDKENVRLVCEQEWLNDNDVAEKREPVFEQRFDAKQGVNRGSLTMKEMDGDSTRWVRLAFSIVSGENEATKNVSAGTTVDWKVSSDIAQKDAAFVAYISRKARNAYAIDALYAMDPATGAIEQVLPRE
jgi:hypothetical protein